MEHKPIISGRYDGIDAEPIVNPEVHALNAKNAELQALVDELKAKLDAAQSNVSVTPVESVEHAVD